jgi:hypothetical protein
MKNARNKSVIAPQTMGTTNNERFKMYLLMAA